MKLCHLWYWLLAMSCKFPNLTTLPNALPSSVAKLCRHWIIMHRMPLSHECGEWPHVGATTLSAQSMYRQKRMRETLIMCLAMASISWHRQRDHTYSNSVLRGALLVDVEAQK